MDPNGYICGKLTPTQRIDYVTMGVREVMWVRYTLKDGTAGKPAPLFLWEGPNERGVYVWWSAAELHMRALLKRAWEEQERLVHQLSRRLHGRGVSGSSKPTYS